MINGEIKKTLPNSPGVYIFKNANGAEIYIGKAKNLKNRVGSYFSGSVFGKTREMLKEAESLDFIKVNSEFESLLLEARMVRSIMPKYNIELKDDKSPLYIGITKEKYPRIVTLRKKEIGEKFEIRCLYGPFTEGTVAKKMLRRIRKIFPFSDHKLQKKACIYNQIGLCNPCPSQIENETNSDLKNALTKKYKKNITNIKNLLDGKITKLNNELDNEMKNFAKIEDFENANVVKEQIKMINYLVTPQNLPENYIENPNFLLDLRIKEKDTLINLIKDYISLEKLERIECFDIAHLAGTQPTASMVTFMSGESDKKLYRHFKVKNGKKADDPAAMEEIIKRRINNIDEWGKPDLIIVDGGKAQVGVAAKILDGKIPVIGLAKRFETIVIKTYDDFIEIRVPRGPALNLLQRIRNEAHRFARRLHHHRMQKSLLPK